MTTLGKEDRDVGWSEIREVSSTQICELRKRARLPGVLNR